MLPHLMFYSNFGRSIYYKNWYYLEIRCELTIIHYSNPIFFTALPFLLFFYLYPLPFCFAYFHFGPSKPLAVIFFQQCAAHHGHFSFLVHDGIYPPSSILFDWACCVEGHFRHTHQFVQHCWHHKYFGWSCPSETFYLLYCLWIKKAEVIIYCWAVTFVTFL